MSMAGEVVVDTYTLMAMVFGELSRRAEEVMLAIYRGELEESSHPQWRTSSPCSGVRAGSQA